jgi:hypothetical protein
LAVFRAVVFLAVDFLAAFLAGDFFAAFFVVRALVVLRDELLAAEVTFAVVSSSVAGTRASCVCRRSPWSTSHEKVARPGDGYQHFAPSSFPHVTMHDELRCTK